LSYYDDLGVDQDASPEEIRESYRALVRLLHPDQHTDPVLKRSAEAQLRRINQSAAVLADPERRRTYDTELAGRAERRAPIVIQTLPVQKTPAVPLGNLAWVTAALASAGMILWLSSQSQPLAAIGEPGAVANTTATPPTRLSASVSAHSASPDARSVERLRHQLRTVQNERDAAVNRLNHTQGESVVAPTAAPRLAELPAPALSLNAEPPRLPELASAATPQIHNAFVGFWVFPRPREKNKDKTLYPPEFIEASIVERDGSLHGRYRSRYHISDRAISPNVNFEFEGKANGKFAKFPWRGDGGSRGEVQIKLISDHSMEVVWSASDLGQSLALRAGTAVLMRRPD
jgi:DnaJ domain